MAYVYRHIRLDKNQPFYIGIGSDTDGRYHRANSNSIAGTFIKTYPSVIEAAKDNSLGQGNITISCKKKIMYGGFLWRYAKGDELNIEPYSTRINPVIQISKNGSIVAEYENATNAARENNYQKSSILRVCNGKYKQAYGFNWEFKK